jgi:hypothetical protein
MEMTPDDLALSRAYPTAEVKGPIRDGRRLTIMARKKRYNVGEEVRVIHVLEIVEPGRQLLAMGPKPVYGEYVDDRLVTPEPVDDPIYDGLVLPSPDVDSHYEVTSYSFQDPGRHRIRWEHEGQSSNTLEIDVVD